MTTQLLIDHLGARGDGVARSESGSLFVPYTLPGEVVKAVKHGKDRAELMTVLEPSALRATPPCSHFGSCGGCALQHMEQGAYNNWKRNLVTEALRARGIEPPVNDIVPCRPGTRRRAVFAARQSENGVLLGYHAAMSHTVIAVEECPILVPAIAGKLDMLRRLAAMLPTGKQPLRLTVTATETGLDIDIGGPARLAEDVRLAVSRYALHAGIARLSLGGETIVEPVKPAVKFGESIVELPPGAFLQATAEAEAAMAGLVTAHLAGAKRVADLYCGSGTFALRLAKRSETHAVETSGPALAALDRAFRFTSGLRRVTTERRDLDRRPLTAKELSRFDGLVFDPPRAGAEEQVKQIARADVRRVAAVSCNPVTLGRDLSILIEGGYELKSITPIDQFLWSPHVEAVALLERPRKQR